MGRTLLSALRLAVLRYVLRAGQTASVKPKTKNRFGLVLGPLRSCKKSLSLAIQSVCKRVFPFFTSAASAMPSILAGIWSGVNPLAVST